MLCLYADYFSFNVDKYQTAVDQFLPVFNAYKFPVLRLNLHSLVQYFVLVIHTHALLADVVIICTSGCQRLDV